MKPSNKVTKMLAHKYTREGFEAILQVFLTQLNMFYEVEGDAGEGEIDKLFIFFVSGLINNETFKIYERPIKEQLTTLMSEVGH